MEPSDRQVLERLVEAQNRLDAKVERLCVAVERLAGKRSISRADRKRLERLLPAIAGLVGPDEFLACDVAEADDVGLQLVAAGLNARQVGRLLLRAVGLPIGGYVVVRLGEHAGAVLWKIEQVADFPGVQNSSVPRDAQRDAGSSDRRI